jgi:alpha-N-arabinofuranosidase
VASTGTLYIKYVNPNATPSPVTITVDGVKSIASTATAIVLSSASDTDTNTIDAPNAVVPVTSSIAGITKSFAYTFPPYSLTVLVLSTREK